MFQRTNHQLVYLYVSPRPPSKFKPTRLKTTQLALFRFLLPSLRENVRLPPTTAASGVGDEVFEYRLYIFFDKGESYFDSPARESAVIKWVAANVIDLLARDGVRLRLALLSFENELHKPGRRSTS